MSSEVDFSTIEHLDFDITDKPEDSCLGYGLTDNKKTIKNNIGCANPAKVIAIRSCCGVMEKYCMSCYNEICRFHAERQSKGQRSYHSENGKNRHDFEGKPFSQVQFI